LVQETGIGVEDGEFAEMHQAEFRVLGLSLVPSAELPDVKSDVEPPDVVFPWEPEILAGVADELIAAFTRGEGDDHAE
jgi:hypothetical protein